MTCGNCNCPACVQARELKKENIRKHALELFEQNRPAAADLLEEKLEDGHIEESDMQSILEELGEIGASRRDPTFAEHVDEIYYHNKN